MERMGSISKIGERQWLTTSTPLATGGTGTMKKETKTITSITVHVICVSRITQSEIFSMGMAIILRWQWKTGENKGGDAY